MIGFIEAVGSAIKDAAKEIKESPAKEGKDVETLNKEKEADKPLFEQKMEHPPQKLEKGESSTFLPKEYDAAGNQNGNWEAERGDSKWIPSPEKIPGKSNPEGKTWGKILDQYGIDGIDFKDGEPDFSPLSKGTVEIDNFTDNRDKNFAQADIAEAKKRGCTPEEIKKWREENGYTWHERSDCKTMDLVPSEVHNNIPHSGGISVIKNQGA
jgi:hypothetical protein